MSGAAEMPPGRGISIVAPAAQRLVCFPRIGKSAGLGELRRDQVHARPGLISFGVTFALFAVSAWWAGRGSQGITAVVVYTSVVWALPIWTAVLGISGSMIARRRPPEGQSLIRQTQTVPEMLVVVVPTVGRWDTFPALERVLESFTRYLPSSFPNMRIDVVVDENCPAAPSISALARRCSRTRLMTVPSSYATAHGTRFKARAIEYARMRRSEQGEERDDVWVLHMDDDTAVGPDTATALARFVDTQRAAGDHALDLAQGILCYPREHAASRLIWMADAVRPGCDVGLLAATTGRGSPKSGLHGELLLVRASVEGAIGWDFGPRTLVEDAQFALRFCAQFPGRSGWIEARSYGASPKSVRDFIVQRERWVWGLLELASGRNLTDASISVRCRLLMVHNVFVWAISPLAHPLVVALVCVLLRDAHTAPISPLLIPLWATNIAYCVWLYWEGLKFNARASSQARRVWWEPLGLIALLPLFSLWEALGIARGLGRFLLASDARFTVIAKPS